jgi:hypothetical protein
VLNLGCFWTSSFDFHQLSQKFWQFLGVEFGMFLNFKFWFSSTISEVLAVFGCWIWHVFELQVLISINYLRSFGSFWVLNLACFLTSSFDFHQLPQNFWQFWGVEFGMFSSFSFDFQQLLQNLASYWKLKLSHLKRFSFDFKQLQHKKNSLFLGLTWREQNCTPKIGLLKIKRLHAHVHG